MKKNLDFGHGKSLIALRYDMKPVMPFGGLKAMLPSIGGLAMQVHDTSLLILIIFYVGLSTLLLIDHELFIVTLVDH